jgi:RNA polymerase sigma-70 factor (ECF subfamily)
MVGTGLGTKYEKPGWDDKEKDRRRQEGLRWGRWTVRNDNLGAKGAAARHFRLCERPTKLEMDLFFHPKPRVEDFESAAMPHFADLYRTARLLAQDSTEAEDLVQEVYLEAWKSFHRFQTGTNCRAWLFRILFHRLHHFRRRWAKAARVEAFENPEDQDRVVAETPVPQEIRDEDVLQALGKVPIEFREVVLLADVQEFSYKEIAETMKLPLGTVMSRLSRGRKLLRQELAGIAHTFGITPAKDPPRAGEPA